MRERVLLLLGPALYSCWYSCKTDSWRVVLCWYTHLLRASFAILGMQVGHTYKAIYKSYSFGWWMTYS